MYQGGVEMHKTWTFQRGKSMECMQTWNNQNHEPSQIKKS